MKKLFLFSIAVAAVLSSLVSCQKEDRNSSVNKGINVSVVSDGRVEYVETKTAAVEGSKGTYVKWLSSDKIDVFELTQESTYANLSTDKFVSNKTTLEGYEGESDVIASFDVTFTGDKSSNSYTYTAVYPSGAISVGGSNNRFNRFMIPSSQVLIGGNFSDNSDVLIGTPIHLSSRVSEGEKLTYRFKRPGTVVKLILKGISEGETINNVSLVAPENVAGYSKVDLASGTVSEIGYASASKILTISVGDVIATGNDCLWLRVLSGTWKEGDKISITVNTDAAVYEKLDVSLPSDYVFAEGGLTTFGFNLEGCRQGSDGFKYINEGSTGTVDGVTASGNVNTTASNGNPGNSFGCTSANNTTFTFSGFDLTQYSNRSLSLDVKFSYPNTVTTYPKVTVYLSKEGTVIHTDETTIAPTSKVTTYTNYSLQDLPDFDELKLVVTPGTGTSNRGNATTTYGIYIDNVIVSANN